MKPLAYKIVIPARYQSTRLPGKPLLPLLGKPMIQHVFERAQACGADQVVVATDDARIQQSAIAFGAEVCMTRSDHPSGTARIAEVVAQKGWSADTLIVNVQGDEPLIPVELVMQVAQQLSDHAAAGMATVATPVLSAEELFDPNAVKVVLDHQGFALYFSRAPIPWHRDHFAHTQETLPDVPYLRHIGLYGYRVSFLQKYVQWSPSPVEAIESLEQLRVLYYGEKIHVSTVLEAPGHGVDTPDDVPKVEAALQRLLG